MLFLGRSKKSPSSLNSTCGHSPISDHGILRSTGRCSSPSTATYQVGLAMEETLEISHVRRRRNQSAMIMFVRSIPSSLAKGSDRCSLLDTPQRSQMKPEKGTTSCTKENPLPERYVEFFSRCTVQIQLFNH